MATASHSERHAFLVHELYGYLLDQETERVLARARALAVWSDDDPRINILRFLLDGGTVTRTFLPSSDGSTRYGGEPMWCFRAQLWGRETERTVRVRAAVIRGEEVLWHAQDDAIKQLLGAPLTRAQKVGAGVPPLRQTVKDWFTTWPTARVYAA